MARGYGLKLCFLASYLMLAAQTGLAANALPVPATGVYLGIWANPSLASNQEQAIEILEGPAPNGVSHAFALHLVYYKWNEIAGMLDNKGVFQPDTNLAGDIGHGRVPVISWNCDPNVPNSNHVVAGGDASEDAIITATANALKQYPGPVMLRWFWEFNVLSNNQSCRGDTGGTPTPQVYSDFIGAWQHIWTLFQQAGANNVVFLWNPGDYSSNANRNPQEFYPGNGYVDWIGIDTYQRAAPDTFVVDFDQFYKDFTGSQYGNKPIMVGENGAEGFSVNNSEIQAGYLQGLLADIKNGQYPLLKAYDYFDAPGNAPNNWVLDGNGGLAEMAALAASGSFVVGPLSAPAPAISKVANAEGESPTIAPNTWVEIKGSNLAPAGDARIWQNSDFVNGQMPAKLDGVSVTVNGKTAFVYYISPAQINILTPPDAIGGLVQVVVNNNGASASATAQAAALSPSFFEFGDGQHVAAVHANGSLLGPSSLSVPGYTFTPANPGETVLIYANGFGTTSTAVVAGSSSQAGMLSPNPTVTIGGAPASVTFAGLISPGLFQFNVMVPLNAPGGDEPIVATYNGQATQTGMFLTLTGTAPPTSLTYYVAPNGNDSWSGALTTPNAAGTDGPFATIDHARAAVQALKKTGLTQIAVQIRAGTYYLPSTLQFTGPDSGSSTLSILYQNYPGESPVISGGMRVTNWTNVSGNTWKATLPASAKYFENLFYNGARRLRPRLGSGSLGTYFRVAATVYLNSPGPPAAAPDPNCSAYITGSGWECFDRFQYASSDPISASWKNLAPPAGNPCGATPGNAALVGDIEVVDFEMYTASKLRIDCVDTKNQIAYMTGPTGVETGAHVTAHGFIATHRYLVENVEDQLTLAGQWFLDRSTTPWTLTYLANPSENPNTDLVIVPQLTPVMAASNLQYVTFQGLTFEHDNYTVPAAGHPDYELPSDISAAVSIQASQHVIFDSGIVTQTSGAGLEISSCNNNLIRSRCVAVNANGVTANNTVSNSAFYDTGENGIRIGIQALSTDTDANVPQFNTIQNNVVEGFGRTSPNAWGISQGEGHNNVYTHNDVYDGYHTAIGVCECSSINPGFEGTANNTISFNHVYNLFQGIMNDAGSLYFGVGNAVFTATGNKVLNNKVHDVSDASALDADGYGGHGIYLDNQTGLVDVENNLVYRVSGDPLNLPKAPYASGLQNTIKNNILAFGRLGMIDDNNPYPSDSPPSSQIQVFVASNNIFYFDRSAASTPAFYVQNGCTYAAGFPYVQYQDWTSNLYWRSDGAFAAYADAFHVQPNSGPESLCANNTAKWTFLTFAQWQAMGEDLQSVAQNPGFNNPAYPADDYSLPKGSPGAGFVPFDSTQAGRSNPVIKPPAIPATFPTQSFNPATDF